MTITSVLIFIAVLLVLVVVHEFGHFIAAKMLKIRVDEFAFGFPPRLFGKKMGETDYVFNALPLGGYVKILGENPSEGGVKDSRSFSSRPAWQKLLVLAGGVIMNMVLALVVFTLASFGTTKVGSDDPLFERSNGRSLMVVDVTKGSPAEKAGIEPGSTIISMTSADGKQRHSVSTAEEATMFVRSHEDGVTITYQTLDKQQDSVTIAPVYGLIPDHKAIGVALEVVGEVNLTTLEALKKGATDTYLASLLVADGLASFAKRLVEGENVLNEVSGPVGIAKVVHKAESSGLDSLLILVAFLSINLAFFNALPIPALDGGRMLIVIGEAITRRQMNPRIFGTLNATGFGLLMLLFIVVTIKDIFY